MNINDIIPYLVALIVPIITGIGSYIASTSKSKKDIFQLQEQNKLDIEKLLNQHKLDLEAQEQKHKLDIEKMEIEHKHKIELLQKETENKLGSDIMGQMITQVLQSPEIKNQINRSTLDGIKKKR